MEQSRLTCAITYAGDCHDGQTYGGSAYIWHPLRVAEALRVKGYPEVVIIGGLLHDVVEDTDHSLEQVGSMFGDDVAEIVGGLTHDPGVSYRDYMLAMPVASLPVKWEDTLDNFTGLTHMEMGDRRRKLAGRYLRNVATLSARMQRERIMPKVSKMERIVVTMARERYPRGWEDAA